MHNPISARFPAAVLLLLLLSVTFSVGCGQRAEREKLAGKPQGQVLDPRTRVLLVNAREALTARDYPRVLEAIRMVESYNPGLPEATFLRGHVALGMHQLDKARQAFEEVLRSYPRYEAAWHSLGDVAYASGSYRHAITDYRKEIAINPTPQTWLNIGNAYRMLEMPDSALIAFKAATLLSQEYAPAYHARAEVQEQLGEFQEALRQARRALDLQPDNPSYQYLVGALLFELEQIPEAEAILRRAVEGRSWDYSTLYTLGRVLQRLGKEDEAAEVLEKANEARENDARLRTATREATQHGDSARAHVALAEEFVRTGRLEEALERYRRAVALTPNDLTIHQNIASILLAQGDPAATVEQCQWILERDSSRVAVWVIASVAYARLGRRDQSQTAWTRAVQLDPTHPSVQQAIQATR